MSRRADVQSCSEIVERLEAWIDGELDTDEAAGLELHIAGCPSCRFAKSEAEQLVAGLRSLPEFEIPAQVQQSVPGYDRPPIWARFGNALTPSMRRPAPALVALAGVVLAIILVSPWRGPSAPEYPEQEIARATDETKLALAYVASAVQRTELRFKERVLEDGAVIRTVQGLSRSMKIIGEAGTAVADLPATPLPQ